MADLLDKLTEYGADDIYPFHMPGHKRAVKGKLPYDIDITEIDGFDNLNGLSEGEILWQMTADAKALYGDNVVSSHLLVNGATGGIIAAVRASVKSGAGIVIARNCHKAVYRAVEAFDLDVRYCYPKFIKEYGMYTEYDLGTLEDVLKQAKREVNAGALVVTSPTYEGVILDIKAIAEVAHKYNMVLIVDEAHGAHLPFMKPELSAINSGADVVIQSLHKTLPSFTQTAIVHVTNEALHRDIDLVKRVKDTVAQFQTTSPSYVLMASMDECFNMCRDFVEEKTFDGYQMLLGAERDKYKGLKKLKLIDKDDVFAFAYDSGKFVFMTVETDIDGYELMRRLRARKIECEMASDYYVIAMTSVMDSEDGFRRLREAVYEIDGEVNKVRDVVVTKPESAKREKVVLKLVGDESVDVADDGHGHTDEYENSDQDTDQLTPDQVMSILKAKEAPSVKVSLDKIAKQLEIGVVDSTALVKEIPGFVAAEYIYRYPPGVPIIAPGERITKGVVEMLKGVTDEIEIVM